MSSTTSEPNIQNLSRPPIRPSFFCNIFGCKDEHIKVDEINGYHECRRCGERRGFTTFSMKISVKVNDVKEWMGSNGINK